MRDLEQLRIHIGRLSRGLLVAFAVMCVVLGYWHVIRGPKLRVAQHNPRPKERLKITRPGRMLTRDGQVILKGAKLHQQWYMETPGREVFCHLTGYDAKSGLQKSQRAALHALGDYEDTWCRILRGRPVGCDITLTIDAAAQAKATKLMRGRAGAVIAIDPRDGAIRVMVSAPAYDPTTVLETFELFRNHPDKPEFNRALLGQYPPGSVLKVLTAAAAIDQGSVRPDEVFQCSGEVRIDGVRVRCRRPGGHGKLTLTEAFTDSCNVVFAEIGRGMGTGVFRDYVDRFRLLVRADIPLPARSGRMARMNGDDRDVEVALAAFGQGKTLVSPLAIARLSATIANRGLVPAPKLIARISRPDGRVLCELSPEASGQAVSADVAATVAGMMVAVVERGTGKAARIRGVDVAGKTGSAENPSGLAHAWFTGFAPADAPSVAIAVIVENGGSGGAVAAPIAREVMKALLASGQQ